MEFPNIVAEQYYLRAEAWLPSVIARAPEITSADKAFDWFREQGNYIPRRWVREAWGETIRGQQYPDLINRLDPSDTVPRSWMTETSFRYGKQYNYIVSHTVYDAWDPEGRTESVTVSSNEILTQGEVLETSVDMFANYGVNTISPQFNPQVTTIKYRR